MPQAGIKTPSLPRHGCWTCFLRRKKCPGDRPRCSTCRRLGISCYGYGPKPEWMIGGSGEVERREEIRRNVKLTTDKLRPSRALNSMLQRQQHHIEKAPPKGHVNQTSASPVGYPNGPFRGSVDSLLWSGSSRRNYVLLMHYCDVVFPLQFPLYKPPVLDGGTVWFSLFLMQTKPLYNTVLSIAAYHKKSLLKSSNPPTLERDDEDLYNKALKGLQEHVRNLSGKNCIEGLRAGLKVLACVVQLIVFEVSKGGTENWQKHMIAAPGLHPFIATYCTSVTHRSCSLKDTFQGHTQQHLLFQAPPVEFSWNELDVPDLPLTFVDHAAMEFFSSVMLWFDILGAASTGLRPQYDNICAAAFGRPNSKIQLHRIMGCENWAMVAIREIALLDNWKRNTDEGRRVSAQELAERAEPLRRKLQAGIADLCQAENYEPVYNGGRENLVRRITNAFACGACVYLTAVVSGPDSDLSEMRADVSATLNALFALPEPKHLRCTVWPFCVAGCMASRDQQPAFEDLALRAGIDENAFGSSWRALEVMRMYWMMGGVNRRKPGTCGWLDAMDSLGYRVLLV